MLRRECQKIGVVYIAKGQTNEADWFNNLGGSTDYQEFISALGWGVCIIHSIVCCTKTDSIFQINVGTHNGFIGGLDKKANGEFAPYYSTYNTEVIFHVATLMPNVNDEANGKFKKISSDHVIIVWCEDLEVFLVKGVTMDRFGN